MRKKEAKEKYQEQTAKRCRLSPLRASTFKSRKKIRITNKRSDLKKKKKSVGIDVEKLESSCIASGNVKW
jgi:hypothetical protein